MTEKTRDDLHGDRLIVWLGLGLLTAIYGLTAYLRCRNTHLWLDEVLSVSTARLPLGEITKAMWQGAEYSPPTYEYLLHFLVANSHKSSLFIPRIPSVIGLLGAAGCIYLLLRRRLSAIAAVAGFGAVLNSDLFNFAIQARQYALLSFGAALSLVIWDRLDDTRRMGLWSVALWAVLSFCLCLHFYGVVIVSMVGLAELINLATRRSLRWPVWIALFGVGVVELAWLPYAFHLSVYNAGDYKAASFYAHPTVSAFAKAFEEIVTGETAGFLMILIAFIALLCKFIPPTPAAKQTDDVAGSTTGLRKLAIPAVALACLPIIAFLFSDVVTKTFTLRYASAGSLLEGVIVGWIIQVLPWRRWFGTAFLVVIASLILHRSKAQDSLADSLKDIQSLPSNLPIVVGEAELYVELMEAGDPTIRSRLVYLRKALGKISPDPTNENILNRIAWFHPEYDVQDPIAFTANTKAFYVFFRPGKTTDDTTPFLLKAKMLGQPELMNENSIVFSAGVRAHIKG